MNTAADDLIDSLTRCIAEEARALEVVSGLQKNLEQAQTLHAEARAATYAAADDIKLRATQNAFLLNSTLITKLTPQPN